MRVGSGSVVWDLPLENNGYHYLDYGGRVISSQESAPPVSLAVNYLLGEEEELSLLRTLTLSFRLDYRPWNESRVCRPHHGPLLPSDHQSYCDATGMYCTSDNLFTIN